MSIGMRSIRVSLYLLDSRVVGVDLRQPIRDLLADDLAERLDKELALRGSTEQTILYARQHVMGQRERPQGVLPWESHTPITCGRGSNETLLVALLTQSANLQPPKPEE